MKTLISTFILCTLPLSLGACARAGSEKTSTNDVKHTIDRAASDARAYARNAGTSAMDATAPGGQPGRIALTGGLVNGDFTLDARLSVDTAAGRGWAGRVPETESAAVSRRQNIERAVLDDLEALTKDDTFISVGCADAPAAPELQRREFKPNATVANLRANTILICDASALNAALVMIKARTIVLRSVNLSKVGWVGQMISMTASSLVLEGRSTISTAAPDAEVTILAGPSMAITAERVDGDGTLGLSARGASYRRASR